MPIEISYTDDERGVVLTGTGIVAGEDFLASNREIFSRDLATRPYGYILFDANGMTGTAISAGALREAADQGIAVSRYMPHLVFAIYANSDLAYGLARMWEIFVQRSGWKTQVFRTRSAAVAWLREEASKNSVSPITLV